MRCVHCGKEVRTNRIFCIHCGRPVKLEYSHYACEYENFSFWDNLLSFLSKLSSQKKSYQQYKQDVSLTRTAASRTAPLNKNLKDTAKKTGISIEELYSNYTKGNSGKTKDYDK